MSHEQQAEDAGSALVLPHRREAVPRRDAMPAQAQRPADPNQMIQSAIERGMDPDTLRQLMDMRREWMAEESRRAFIAAMSEFKAEPISIEKNVHVFYTTNKGPVDYWHADLAQVSEKIGRAMSKHGLSFRWNTVQESGRVTVTCIVEHRDGHSERTQLSASADNSGGKNDIQAIGSTVSYLQRYTLQSAAGIASGGSADDDGRGVEAGRESDPEPRISEDQAEDLKARAKLTSVDTPKLLQSVAKTFKIPPPESIDALPARCYEAALNSLKAREERMREAGTITDAE